MAFFNRETGELSFSDGFTLSFGLAMDEVAQRLHGRTQGAVRLQSHAVPGGRLVPVCMVDGGAVQSVSLCVGSLNSKEPATPARQRAFLFSRMGLSDPCADTRETVRVLCPFGELLFLTDPYTGRSEVRLHFIAR